MTGLRIFAPAALAFCLAAGCAPAVKETPPDSGAAVEKKREDMMRTILEQVDKSAAEIRTTREELASLRDRLAAVGARVDSAASTGNSALGALHGEVSLLASRIDRIDSAFVAPKQPERKPVPRPAGVIRPAGWNVEAAYNDALASYQARKFEAAISAFTEILTVAPSNSLADNAQFWIGESWYSMRNYEKALQAFTRVFTFPNSNKAADAHLKVGMIYTLMNNMSAAREELKLIIRDFPSSGAAKLAAAKLQALGQ